MVHGCFGGSGLGVMSSDWLLWVQARGNGKESATVLVRFFLKGPGSS